MLSAGKPRHLGVLDVNQPGFLQIGADWNWLVEN